jgi:hypothetical protein
MGELGTLYDPSSIFCSTLIAKMKLELYYMEVIKGLKLSKVNLK